MVASGWSVDVPQMHPKVVTHVWCPHRNRYHDHDSVRLSSRSRITEKRIVQASLHQSRRPVTKLI